MHLNTDIIPNTLTFVLTADTHNRDRHQFYHAIHPVIRTSGYMGGSFVPKHTDPVFH